MRAATPSGPSTWPTSPSASTTPKTNAEFAKHVEADYPILADPTKAVARAYGVLGMIGMASRWTFYIGKDGRILHIDKAVKVSTAGRISLPSSLSLNIAKAMNLRDSAALAHEDLTRTELQLRQQVNSS